jgi:hypothetical protein
LALLRRKGVTTSWRFCEIIAGQEWKGQIDRHLNDADIILFLISADFLASDYCYEVEMKSALARHRAEETCVIPIIIRPVDWSNAPLATVQALPRETKPVARWEDGDEARTDFT